MSNACQDLQSHLPAYLDSELDDAELREVESHLSDCDSCQEAVETADRLHSQLRAHLRATPQASDLLRGRVQRSLDQEDQSRKKQRRKERLSWALPGTASVVAAVALALFLYKDLSNEISATSVRPQETHGRVAEEAARQHLKDRPLFVSSDHGAVSKSAASYLEQPVRSPQFNTSEVRLMGWTPATINGKESASFVYEVTDRTGRHRVHVYAVSPKDLDVRGQKKLSFPGGRLWIDSAYGFNAVTYAESDELAYVFSSDMSSAALIELVTETNIVNTLPSK